MVHKKDGIRNVMGRGELVDSAGWLSTDYLTLHKAQQYFRDHLTTSGVPRIK